MWIDIGVLGFIVFMIIRGYNRGFGKSLSNLIGWVIAIITAYYFSGNIKEYFLGNSLIRGWIDSLNVNYLPESFTRGINSTIAEVFAGIIAFLLIIIIVKILVRIFFSLFAFVKKIPTLGFFNKILGAFLGLAKGIIILWVLSLFMIPLIASMNSNGLTGIFEESQIVTALYEYNSTLGMF